MAELATIARPYAEALFRVAKAGDLEAWSSLVLEMAQVATHPDVVALANNPKLSEQQVRDIFTALLKSPVNDEAKNFIAMLVANNRLALLPQIGVQFHLLKNAQEGAADAQIFSAFALTDAQINALVSKLEKKFQRKLHPSVIVDSNLIGGVRVVVGDEVLDNSVRARLQKMRHTLTA